MSAHAEKLHGPVVLTMDALADDTNANPQLGQIFSSVCRTGKLTPLDASKLFSLYSNPTATPAPSVDFLRLPKIVECLIRALFTPGNPPIAASTSKYTYLLAYASLAPMDNSLPAQSAFQKRQKTIATVHKLCSSKSFGLDPQKARNTLRADLDVPVIAVTLQPSSPCRTLLVLALSTVSRIHTFVRK